MTLRDIFTVTSGTKKLLAIMTVLSITGFLIAYFYYDNINKSEDPRVIDARKMLVEYNKMIDNKEYKSALVLVDKLENIYSNIPYYRNAFEMGVVHNNRAAVHLLLGLYETDKDDVEQKTKHLNLAKNSLRQSVEIYEDWLQRYERKDRLEIKNYISEYFKETNPAFNGYSAEDILEKRVEDILSGKIENKRRLSICYTNLGIIYRHQYQQEKAMESYLKAIELWKDNPTAKNNLNVLLGKPVEGRSVLEKMFPPDKDEEK